MVDACVGFSAIEWSVSFPFQNSVIVRILDFRRWVIFELLIDVVFGCWEYRMKKGKARKIIFLNFFFICCVGVVDSIQ